MSTTTTNRSFTKPDKSETGWHTMINGALDSIDALFAGSSYTSGSVLFANSSGAIDQDNAYFSWDTTNKKLLVKRGTNANSSGQPSGTFAQTIYNATNATGEHGLFVKNNWLANTSKLIEAGNDLVAGAYTPYMILYGDGGLVLGSPTGGSKTSGNLNVSGNIYKNNTAFNNPAYVIEHWIKGKIEKYIDREGANTYVGLMDLLDVEKFAKENFHLPRVPEYEPAGIFTRTDVLLEKVEEIFIYLFGHERRLRALEDLNLGRQVF